MIHLKNWHLSRIEKVAVFKDNLRRMWFRDDGIVVRPTERLTICRGDTKGHLGLFCGKIELAAFFFLSWLSQGAN